MATSVGDPYAVRTPITNIEVSEWPEIGVPPISMMDCRRRIIARQWMDWVFRPLGLTLDLLE